MPFYKFTYLPHPLGTTPPFATPSKCDIPKLQREKVSMYLHAKSQVYYIKNDKVMPIYKFTYVPHPLDATPPRYHTSRCHTL